MENNILLTDETTLAAVLKVLADPKRLRILEMLVQGVHCNCEIAAHLGLSLSLISHHLRVLCSTTIRIKHRRQLEIPTRSSEQSG